MHTVAPFLRLDSDPYLVVSEGRLFWIQDAYTTSSYFPYAQSTRRHNFNYIRNSVKVVIGTNNCGLAIVQLVPEHIQCTCGPVFFRPVQATRGYAARPSKTHPLPGRPVFLSGGGLPHLPHGHSGGVL